MLKAIDFVEKYLVDLQEYARVHFFPIIMDDSKEKLLNLIKENKIKNILEIGTCIGYSGSVILTNFKDVKMVTIEINPWNVQIAKKTFSDLNLNDRVELVECDAFEYIKNTNQKFDLIFLDGPKGQYKNYLPYLINILNLKGFIFADNIYFKGYVNMSDSEYLRPGIRTMVKNLREYNKLVSIDDKLNSKFYDEGDGICITQKIKE
jgi:predicted O-methyltransferase YrrM